MNTKRNQQELHSFLAQQPSIHPKRRASVVPIMQALQNEHGYLNDAAIDEVAHLTGLSTTEVEELATFYTLIYRYPVGRHVVQICDSVCCSIHGADELLVAAEKYSGVPLGSVTPDRTLSVLPSICLGLCDRAPAALVDGEGLGPLDEVALKTLLRSLREED